MGIWNKIGKIALTAAPYVAAPFTGGASLMATGLANKAVQKWSESDAKKAAAKGLAPSKFDSVLGKVGTASSIGTSFIPTNALGSIGMLGSAGKLAGTAGKVANIASNVNKGVTAGTSILGAVKAGQSNQSGESIPAGTPTTGHTDPSANPGIGPTAIPSGVMPRGGYGYNENPMNQLDQSSPNLAQSIFQGRQQGIKNQPFRKGYDVNLQDPNSTTANPLPPITHRMGPIFGDSNRRKSRPAA